MHRERRREKSGRCSHRTWARVDVMIQRSSGNRSGSCASSCCFRLLHTNARNRHKPHYDRLRPRRETVGGSAPLLVHRLHLPATRQHTRTASRSQNQHEKPTAQQNRIGDSRDGGTPREALVEPHIVQSRALCERVKHTDEQVVHRNRSLSGTCLL